MLAQHVINAIEAAAVAVEELSKMGQGMDKARVTQLCQDFLVQMKVRRVG